MQGFGIWYELFHLVANSNTVDDRSWTLCSTSYFSSPKICTLIWSFLAESWTFQFSYWCKFLSKGAASQGLLGGSCFEFRTRINTASGCAKSCYSTFYDGNFFRSPGATWSYTLEWDVTLYSPTHKWANRMCSGSCSFLIHHFPSLKTIFWYFTFWGNILNHLFFLHFFSSPCC